jgi:hypothetical protein
MTETYIINSISNDTTRFLLIENGGRWHAEHRVLCGDGSWLTTWATDYHPNQLGPRQAIHRAFGV